MTRKIFISFICLLCSIMLVHANDPEITASLAADTILIGDQINLNIRIETDKNDLSNYIILNGESGFADGIEILGMKTDTSITEDLKIYNHHYLITSFDSGLYTIPKIPVIAISKLNQDTLFTPELILRVNIPEVDTMGSVKDIKEPMNTPFSLKELIPYTWYIVGGVTLLAVVLLLLWYFKKRRPSHNEAVENIPPHVKALKKLDYLKTEKIWQKGHIKEHYTIMSDAIRVYIEERYGIDAMESITSEILYKFKKYAYDDASLLDLLDDLLGMSDLVKFAKEDPSPAENETNLNKAYIFIEKTKNEEPALNKLSNDKEPGNV